MAQPALSRNLSSEVAELYTPLFSQVSYLHAQWEIYRQLYVAGPETFQLLKWAADGFFRVVQDTLASEILLTISRLTDAKQTGRGNRARDNLSLDQLTHSVDQSKFPVLRAEIDNRLTQSQQACAFARDVRNKLLAHSDLSTSLRDREAVISQATTTNIDAALVSIVHVMNAIPAHFDGSTVVYEIARMPDDGNSLLNRLRDSRNYWQHVESQLFPDGA
ncbi:MAG: AbiU2 domain-containing protein [Pyrinomonadaceae bacterium]